MAKRVLIVGGVAGGMSCAARIKRLDETMDVTVFEKGNAVSFANCGMPYYVGGVIAERESMIVQSAETLRKRYGLNIQTNHEVERIHVSEKAVDVRNLATGESARHEYDVLVLATGAGPMLPPIPGADGPNVYTLNSLSDMDRLRERAVAAQRACIIGAGFIGLELAENLQRLGLSVTVVEMLDQVLPPMDKEMTAPLLQELKLNGVETRLEARVAAIDEGGVRLADGVRIESDLVCLCAGVVPRTGLALEAGLELGPRGHLMVDAAMRTSGPDIYAVGDAVQVTDRITETSTAVPLAGPANRQARVAADNICGRTSEYPGVQGASIIQLFNQKAASVGMSEKRLRQMETPHFRVYIHPMQHARYYPGAVPVSIKGLFSPEGRLLGAQVVGTERVDVVVDVLSTALIAGVTADDLEDLELVYSPQFDSAKSGVNMLGYTANNLIKGDARMIEADAAPRDIFWLDVRDPEETECGVVPGATIIPLESLRERLGELPRDRMIGAYCAVGLRGYIACRMLAQQGFNVYNLNGGYRTWSWFYPSSVGTGASGCIEQAACAGCVNDHVATGETQGKTVKLDVCGLQCPGPITKVKQTMESMQPGETLDVVSSDRGFIADIPAWCASTGNTLLEAHPDGAHYRARIVRGKREEAQAAPSPTPGKSAKTIVCFSDDLDRVMATFVIANGAAAMNSEVTIFFTFWGLNVLKKQQPPAVKKGLLDTMFGMMMPRGPSQLRLSKMHMAGMGTRMMRHVMRSKKVMSPEELIAAAREAGVKLVACAMSMDVMGVHKDELMDGVEIGGVGAYLGAANDANVNLFI